MDKEALESYFKSLCDTFYIAYTQLKKLEKEEKDLEKRKKELVLEEYKKKKRKLSASKKDVEKLCSFVREGIAGAIYRIVSNSFTIKVESEKEIIALMYFFKENKVSVYKIIDIEEESLTEFSSNKEMYKEFLEAYRLSDDGKMKEVIRKYY